MPNVRLQGLVGPAVAFRDVALTTIGRMNMAGLRPEHDVLDIGCGVGRTARYLCDYLNTDARYEGFDIMEEMIRWCQANITPSFPNFQFQLTSLSNTAYKPGSNLPSAADFEFPYPDQSFDFAIAHSVFTHLMPNTATNYLREIKRVLRPGAISYSTWLLYHDQPSASPNSLIAAMQLDSSGEFAVDDPDTPESAIGYEERFVRESYRSSGLNIIEPIYPGFARLQDVIVAVKQPSQ